MFDGCLRRLQQSKSAYEDIQTRYSYLRLKNRNLLQANIARETALLLNIHNIVAFVIHVN